MTAERRTETRQRIVTRPDGSLFDKAAFDALMREWDAAAPKAAKVARLSAGMPELQITGRKAA